MKRVELAGGVAIDVPNLWVVELEPAPLALLVAAEPDEDVDPFRANVVVTSADMPDGTTLRQSQLFTEERQAAELAGYTLLDLENATMAGDRGVRRLACYSHTTGASVSLSQWALLHEGREITLTASVATMRYPLYAPLFATIAESLRLGIRSAPVGDR